MLAVGGYYVVQDMKPADVVVDIPVADDPVGEQGTPEDNAEENPDDVIPEDVPVFDEPVGGPIDNLEVDIDGNSENVPESEKPDIVTKKDNPDEVKPETNAEETPATKPVETPAPKPATKPAEKTATKSAPKPAAKPAEKPAQEPVVAQQPEQPAQTAPAVAYRVRKSANDAKSQIGAFADFMKAKRFAIGNASDGYKVFDMDGNLVFAP